MSPQRWTREGRILRGSLRAGILSLVATAAVSLGAEAGKATPRLALICDPNLGLAESALYAQIEASLLKDPRLQMVERGEIQRALLEQQVQAMLNPDACNRRALLGSLLKADVLVILRAQPVQEKKRRLDVVICETKLGLRLVVEQLAWMDAPEADAEKVRAVLDAGLHKLAEGFDEILAVPAFMNMDISRASDYLQVPFARMVEAALLKLPRIRVVEIGEARALAEESNLRMRDDGIVRPLPLYLMGEYSTRGRASDRLVSIRLVLKRGEKELRTADMPDVKEADIPAALTRACDLVRGQPVGTGVRFDPKAEFDAVKLRADAFYSLNSFGEALPLYEICALLAPENREAHGQAAITRLSGFGYSNDVTRAEAERVLSDLSLIFDHMQKSWNPGVRLGRDEVSPITVFSKHLEAFHAFCGSRAELDPLRERAMELARAKQDAVIRYFRELRLRDNIFVTEDLFRGWYRHLLLAVRTPGEDHFETIKRIINDAQCVDEVSFFVTMAGLLSVSPKDPTYRTPAGTYLDI